MEWQAKNTLNSFNSTAKGLSYYHHYEQIMEWMKGKTNFLPPPIEANIDPYAECQLACGFCNAQRYIKNNREEVGEMRKLPTEYLMKLVDFLGNWGVKACCFSGGGEDTLHDGLPQVLDRVHELGMDSSVVTNMVTQNLVLRRSLMQCRWIAMSIDAADRETYKKIKGADCFDKVITNIEKLVQERKVTGSDVDVAFKVLIMPDNQYHLYEAARLAKSLGVTTIHIRPCDFERDDVGAKKLQLDKKAIEEQFALCHEIETSEFHVFTITHKFDDNFHNKKDFKNCLATPLLIPILTDGNWYTCVDHKMKEEFRMGSAFPNPSSILDFWGSEEHRQRLLGIIPCDDCQCRCTFGKYNEQIESCVESDALYRNFP